MNESGNTSENASVSGGDVSSDVMENAVADALLAVLEGLVAPIEGLIETHATALVHLIIGTPHPSVAFERPIQGVWPVLYDHYWELLIPLALLVWGLSVGAVIVLEATGHLFSSYHRARLKRRALVGLFGILGWWWLAAISLQFVAGLTQVIAPDLSQVTLFETLSFGSIGLLGVVISLFVDFALFLMIALVYLLREVTLYMYVLLMPLLIALWIPGVGPLTAVARFAERLASFYVPFLFMTLPVAVLFRLGEILGATTDLSIGGIGAWIAALVLPLMAVLVPFVLFWQAGAVFFLADRAGQRVSTRRAQERVATTRAASADASHGAQNLVRGVRGASAVRRDGQTTLNSGTSRAHRTGRHLRTALSAQGLGASETSDSDAETNAERYRPREDGKQSQE